LTCITITHPPKKKEDLHIGVWVFMHAWNFPACAYKDLISAWCLSEFLFTGVRGTASLRQQNESGKREIVVGISIDG
jgi:hypothetical protein